MTITYPRAGLLSATRWRQQRFALVDRQEVARTAGGASYALDLGPALWSGAWSSGPLTLAEGAAVDAELRALRGSVGTFLGWDLAHPAPAAHPGGTGLGQPVIKAVALDGRTFSLSGLTPGAVLTAGDRIAWVAGSGRALHVLLSGGTADGAGEILGLDVDPAIRRGGLIGLAVELAPARCLMRIDPDSISEGAPGPFQRSWSFSATEVLG